MSEGARGRVGEGARIRTHRELDVFQTAMTGAMRVFEVTKRFPQDERYSLTDQIRRSSRSVCANIGEAGHKRRYPAHFVSKLNDAEGEAEETRVWLELATRCGYLKGEEFSELDDLYDKIIAQLVRMLSAPGQWKIS